jgi:hypothetical protein
VALINRLLSQSVRFIAGQGESAAPRRNIPIRCNAKAQPNLL